MGWSKVGIITLGMWYEPLGRKIWRPWVNYVGPIIISEENNTLSLLAIKNYFLTTLVNFYDLVTLTASALLFDICDLFYYIVCLPISLIYFSNEDLKVEKGRKVMLTAPPLWQSGSQSSQYFGSKNPHESAKNIFKPPLTKTVPGQGFWFRGGTKNSGFLCKIA